MARSINEQMFGQVNIGNMTKRTNVRLKIIIKYEQMFGKELVNIKANKCSV